MSEPVFVTPQSRGVIRLPRRIHDRLHLDEPGVQLEVTEEADGSVRLRSLLPVLAEQRWFWSERWQQMEREADADISGGRVAGFESVDDLLADLDE